MEKLWWYVLVRYKGIVCSSVSLCSSLVVSQSYITMENHSLQLPLHSAETVHLLSHSIQSPLIPERVIYLLFGTALVSTLLVEFYFSTLPVRQSLSVELLATNMGVGSDILIQRNIIGLLKRVERLPCLCRASCPNFA